MIEHSLVLGIFVAICLALSFLFSGMEAGVLALNPLRIRQQTRAGKKPARLLQGYLANPENFLWTIFIGNTVATFTAFSLLIVLLYQWLSGRPAVFLASFAALVFLFYALCDLLPKMLFRQFPNRLSLLSAAPFRVAHFALSPLVAVMAWFSDLLLVVTRGRSFRGHLFATRSEFRHLMQESSQALSSEERNMIDRVLDLQNLTVASILAPFDRVASVSTRTPMTEVLELCRKSGLTRFPVWQESNPRRIVGIVSSKHFLYLPDLDPRKPAGAYLRPALYLQEETRLDEALKKMQAHGQRLAIVLGYDRRELGIVTLQDILRSFFGEVSL
jgi:putative hemolysin